MKALARYLAENKLNIILSVVAIFIMWAVWVIAYFVVQNDFVVPSFSQTMVKFGQVFTQTRFWLAFGNTLLRTLIAFAVSFITATICAIFASVFKPFASFLNPFMAFLRAAPTMALILMLLLWTSHNVAPIIVTVLVLFPMIYTQIFAAINGVDDNLRQMVKCYCVPLKDQIFKMYLPLAAPNVLMQTGASVSLGLKIMVSAEVMASTYRSIGGLMQNAKNYVEIAELAALTIIVVLVGLLVEIAFYWVGKLCVRWR